MQQGYETRSEFRMIHQFFNEMSYDDLNALSVMGGHRKGGPFLFKNSASATENDDVSKFKRGTIVFLPTVAAERAHLDTCTSKG